MYDVWYIISFEWEQEYSLILIRLYRNITNDKDKDKTHTQIDETFRAQEHTTHKRLVHKKKWCVFDLNDIRFFFPSSIRSFCVYVLVHIYQKCDKLDMIWRSVNVSQHFTRKLFHLFVSTFIVNVIVVANKCVQALSTESHRVVVVVAM